MKKKILYAIFVICIVFFAGCGTKENADFVCASGNADVDKRVEEIVKLIDDNEKIESMEWVEENRCYRGFMAIGCHIDLRLRQPFLNQFWWWIDRKGGIKK